MRILLFLALTVSVAAQTKTVLKTPATNALTESLVVPSGKTLTIASGATITNSGTATGFGGAWGSITGTLSSQTDLQTALDAKASTSSLSSYLTTATASSTYAPLASPTFTGTVTIPSGASISGYLTTATAATTYQPLDSDLTSIAALTTTSYGRGLLTLANAAALRSSAELVIDKQVAGVTLEGAANETVEVIVQSFASISSLDGEWFDLAGNAEMVRFWFDVDNASTPPSGTGVRLVEINLENTDARFDVATKISSALSNDGFFGTLGLNGISSGSDPIGREIVYNVAGPQSTPSTNTAIIEVTVTTPGSLGTPKLNAMSGALLTGLNASNISSGTLNIARIADGAVTSAKVTNGTLVNEDISASAAIALSKLATTGTASASTYLRGDGAWTAVDLSSYLPLTGGTLTGPLGITGGTVTASTPPLTQTQTWNAGGTTFRGVEIAHTVTGAAAASTHLRILGGASASSEKLSVREDKTVITGTESAGRIFSLVSSFGTCTFGVGGGGALVVNECCMLGGLNGISGFQVNNSANGTFLGWDGGCLVPCIRPAGSSTLQIGFGAASPTAYLIRGASARAGTDTNSAGASLTFTGGNGTGIGVGGDLIEATYMTGSSGTAANTLQTRAQAIARFVNLTEDTATSLARIALASGKVTGGTATLTTWASDGTDHQALTSEVRFAVINKAGTLTATCSQTDGTTAASAGTLTVTYDTTQAASFAITGTESTNTINATAHGLQNGMPIVFSALTGGTLLATNTTYYVIAAATDTFQVSTTLGGSAFNFTSDISAGTTLPSILLLRANATSSLTQTILRCRLVITAINGDDVQTVTP